VLIFLRSSTAAHTPRMNCDEMAEDRLTVCKQELLQDFARLVSISSIFFGFLKWIKMSELILFSLWQTDQ